jgi:hypothetical protein
MGGNIMNRYLFHLVVLMTIVSLLLVADTSGLTQAAPSGSAASSFPSYAPPASPTSTPTYAGEGPSSSPSGQLSPAVAPTIVETAPVAPAAGPQAPTFNWNRSLRYVGNVLKPRENDVNYGVSGGGGCVHVISGDAWEVWSVPLILAEGTQVQFLRMYYYDNDTTTAMYGWLTKYDSYGAVVQEWPVTSADGGFNYSDIAITPPQTIDYNNYSYVINWRPIAASTDLRLCGFRVFYYQPSAAYLPMLRK